MLKLLAVEVLPEEERNTKKTIPCRRKRQGKKKETRRKQYLAAESGKVIIVLDCCNANTRINVMKCENPVKTVLKLEYGKLNHW